MVKWSSKAQGKALCGLFANGLANPNFTKACDIDPIKALKPEFAELTVKRFRENFKNTAKDYIVNQEIEGQPLKVASLPKLVKSAGKYF